MAMTLRLDDDLDQRLEAYAAATGLSKQKIIEESLSVYLTRAQKTASVEEITRKILARDKELFDRLADA